MAQNWRTAIWNAKDLLEPFSWPHATVVHVVPDLFEPETRGGIRDEAFAVMALCQHHRSSYAQPITNNTAATSTT